MAIKAVGFDYLGVTARLSGRSIFDAVGEVIGQSPDAVRSAYQLFNQDFQINAITKEQLWERVATQLHAGDKIDAIQAAADAGVPRVDPGMIALVDKVHAAGYKTGLLSNLASGTAWDAALRAEGIDKHFDVVILSGDVGMAKPNLELFKLFAGRLGVDCSELVYTDDRATSFTGAETLGITPVLFTSQTQLESDLRRLGVQF